MKIARTLLVALIGFSAVSGLMLILKPIQAAPLRSITTVGDHVILSEVFYDAVSTDDGNEWVELYNPTSSTIDLGNYSLGNGGTDYTYSKAQLSGTLPAFSCWVVGGPTSTLANFSPVFDQIFNFNPDFQNGATPADGIALFDVKAISITPSTIPIDAVIYGTANTNNLIDESGVANPPDVGAAALGKSNERVDITGTWRIQNTPTPNNCSVITTTVSTPPPTPPGSVLISGVHFNAYANGDEGFRLTNITTQVITLTNWIAHDNSQSLPLTGTLDPSQSIWLAKRAITFTQQFGFKPDYEYELDSDPSVPNLPVIGSIPALSADDALAIREGASNWIDAVAWGTGTINDIEPISPTDLWIGSNVVYTNSLGSTGDILYRRLAEATGKIVTDTNTALDWANDRTDPISGRKVMYPGWDLEKFWQTAKVTATSHLTVAIAPDNAFRVISDFLGSAQHSIKIEIYSFDNVGLVAAITRTLQRGVSVTILMEGSPVGGLPDEEKWVCQQIEGAGGQCWFMIGDSAQKIHDRYDYIHAKLTIIDDQVVAIGSENFSPRSMPNDDFSDGTLGQRGTYLITDAPGVVTRALEIWNADFDPIHHRDIYRWTSGDPKYGAPPIQFTPVYSTGGTGYRIYFPNPITVTAPLTFELLTAPESSLRAGDSLLGLIDQAGPGDSIDGEQLNEPPHWGKSTSNSIDDPNVRLEALINAASRGAHVRVLLDKFFDDVTSPASNLAAVNYIDSLRAISSTLLSNLEVRRGDPAFGGIHNKMYLFNLSGRKVAHVGSLNGTEASNKVNREIALQVESDAAYEYLRAMFEYDWAFQPRVYLPIVLNKYIPPADHLLVSKVFYLGSTGIVTGSEWVQIYNPTPITVSLSTYKIGDEETKGGGGFGVDGMWSFPLTATIAPNQKLNIAMTRFGFYDRYGYYPDFVFYGGTAGFDQMRTYLTWTNVITFSLANSGDEVLLLGPIDQLTDGVAWGTGALPGNVTCPAFVTPPYPSLARTPIWADTNNCPNDFVADPNALP